MDNEIFSNNLACLPQYLKDLMPPPSNHEMYWQSVQIATGKNGWPVGIYRMENNHIHTNSLVDPWAEAQQWAASINYKDTKVSIIYGCGFGYPLLEYAKRKKAYTETLIFEQNVELFYAMLQCIDLQPLLSDPSCHFIVGNIDQIKSQLKSLLYEEFLLRSTNLTVSFTWLAHRHEKNLYLTLHEWFLHALRGSCMSIGNSIYDTLVGVYNTLDNAQEIICSPQLSSLRNAFMGKPAFIVSNGPSLDRNIDTLTRAVGKSLIITAESSLRPCLIRGIRPDAVAVTERTPNVYHIHFENQRLPSDLVLIGLTLIDPRIPKLFQGSFVPVFRSGESSCRWIQQTLTDDVCGLHSGSSSAHLAFEFAVWTGANPIVFVGQDLAFGRDKTTHSQLSAYAESTLAHQVKSLREQPAFYVPGVNGERVLTTRLWDEFRAWFEDQISLHPEVHFIDATEGGAYIHGTELMTLDEVVSTYCTEYVDTALYQYVQSASVLPNTSEIAKKYSTLLSKVKDMKNQFHSLTQSANDDIQDCRLVELACQLKAKHPKTEVPSFIEALVERSSIACEKFTDVQIAPYTQHALFAFHKQINDLGEVDSVDSLYLATRLYRDMYECLKKICAVMTQQFDLAERHVIQKSEIDHT